MTINPWMDRHPRIGSKVGRIVLSYGEIELGVGLCLGVAIQDIDTAQRVKFRIIGETARIEAADALMYRHYKKEGMADQYADAIGAARHCVTIRNNYAHCHWADHYRAGVFFTRLDQPAKASETFEELWKHIDHKLVSAQLEYFNYAQACLNYISDEIRVRRKQLRHHAFVMPQKRGQPIPHNRLSRHIPPWLPEDEQRRHRERAQEAERPRRSKKLKSKVRKPSQAQKRRAALARASKA